VLRAADDVLEHSIKSIELEHIEALVSEFERAATSQGDDR
jgi:hypothetical protein